jgi:two-component system, chemotaxis family, chemotaxis protein CheY
MAKIVVVDDSLYMRSILKHILNKNGHEIVGEAESYEQALEVIEKQVPDLVTLDIILKDRTGLDVLKEVKITFPDIIVIMVSAVGEEFIVEEARDLGAHDYIIKPFNESIVSETVNKVCIAHQL